MEAQATVVNTTLWLLPIRMVTVTKAVKTTVKEEKMHIKVAHRISSNHGRNQALMG